MLFKDAVGRTIWFVREVRDLYVERVLGKCNCLEREFMDYMVRRGFTEDFVIRLRGKLWCVGYARRVNPTRWIEILYRQEFGNPRPLEDIVKWAVLNPHQFFDLLSKDWAMDSEPVIRRIGMPSKLGLTYELRVIGNGEPKYLQFANSQLFHLFFNKVLNLYRWVLLDYIPNKVVSRFPFNWEWSNFKRPRRGLFLQKVKEFVEETALVINQSRVGFFLPLDVIKEAVGFWVIERTPDAKYRNYLKENLGVNPRRLFVEVFVPKSVKSNIQLFDYTRRVEKLHLDLTDEVVGEILLSDDEFKEKFLRGVWGDPLRDVQRYFSNLTNSFIHSYLRSYTPLDLTTVSSFDFISEFVGKSSGYVAGVVLEGVFDFLSLVYLLEETPAFGEIFAKMLGLDTTPNGWLIISASGVHKFKYIPYFLWLAGYKRPDFMVAILDNDMPILPKKSQFGINEGFVKQYKNPILQLQANLISAGVFDLFVNYKNLGIEEKDLNEFLQKQKV